MIPPMTDPLGKHWHQPNDIRNAPMSDTHVLLTHEQFKNLKEYSRSTTGGVYAGKCWRSYHLDYVEGLKSPEMAGKWYLKWYEATADVRYCKIETRIIVIGKLKTDKD